jgi:glycosyltransferase involved in cell wall biosynthesis
MASVTASTTPVRVLHVITRLIVGGAQENTMWTADLLNRGWPGSGRYQVDVVAGTQTGPEGSLVEEVRERGTAVTLLPALRREPAPFRDLAALVQLVRLIRRGRYRIVHTHSSKAGVLGRLAARIAGVPAIVHTVHGWSFHDGLSGMRRRVYVALERIGDRCGHSGVLVTSRDRDKGAAAGIRGGGHYRLIRSGIELDRFGHPGVSRAEMRDRLGIPEAAPVVGTVTRLSTQKAPLDLVEAFAIIREGCPDARFVIVGDGPLRSAVETRIRAHGLGSRVVMTGLRRDIPELLPSFDVFVLTSLWEGLPRVLPQAMASGVPIVCTRADGNAEAVQDGIQGYLVAPGQPAEMAGRVLELLADADVRGRMGQAGRQRAQEFDVRQMAREIDALYRELLERR